MVEERRGERNWERDTSLSAAVAANVIPTAGVDRITGATTIEPVVSLRKSRLVGPRSNIADGSGCAVEEEPWRRRLGWI